MTTRDSGAIAAPNRPWYRHAGSTIAIVLGLLYFLSGLNASISGLAASNGGLVAGPVMVLGALAYRSAKKRALGDATAGMARQIIETILILLIVASVAFRNDLKTAIAIHPVPNFVIPVWCVVAYLIAAVRAWRVRPQRRQFGGPRAPID